MQTIAWRGDHIVILDQTLLPGREVYRELRSVAETAEAIRTLRVRGAPLIGVAAAYGVALGAVELRARGRRVSPAALEETMTALAATRPTAVNLPWALNRMRQAALAAHRGADLVAVLAAEAQAIHAEDIELCRRIGEAGAGLFPDGSRVLTHCNAGALAATGIGTALAPLRTARAAGAQLSIYVDETRPLLQGARLTAWELLRDGFPVTLITDNMAGALMAQGKIDRVVVGADRIAANGDVANKIGTYTVAVLAHAHGIPLYVAAPWSTVDMAVPSGDAIPIEQRAPGEVTSVQGVATAPEGVSVENPAFDVTPARLITALITDRGVLRPPYSEALREASKL
ncbi:MAG: S-methyl-5-thioribose-1-phosphate isomerase [Chloroflexi bacterium]|nr:S-methyl-5-thioribose-1-phosphate isomerase [Chloroflexota bacterium]